MRAFIQVWLQCFIQIPNVGMTRYDFEMSGVCQLKYKRLWISVWWAYTEQGLSIYVSKSNIQQKKKKKNLTSDSLLTLLFVTLELLCKIPLGNSYLATVKIDFWPFVKYYSKDLACCGKPVVQEGLLVQPEFARHTKKAATIHKNLLWMNCSC